MKTAAFLGLIMVVSTIVPCSSYMSAQSASSIADPSGNESISLLLYLNRLGTEHNSFFTIESSWLNGETTSLASYPVPDYHTRGSLESELDDLRGLVPNLEFQVDKSNSQIIHAIDQRLMAVPSYSMDQVMQEFDFQGRLDNLLAEVSRRGVRIAADVAAPRGDPLSRGFDSSTGVVIKEHTPNTVRSILSNFLPLARYSHVLWTTTTERQASAVTAVSFRGFRSSEERSLPLTEHLYWLAKEHDYFFTIEESWVAGEAMNAFVSHEIPRESTRVELLNELQRLSRIVPNFEFEIDSLNPRIVHILDMRLNALQPYSLRSAIDNIDITGKLPDLLADIRRRGIEVAFEKTTVMPGGHVPDIVTVVHVKARNAQVRSILSNSLPLANYKRLLWTGTTERRSGAVTVIDFQGQLTRKE